MKYLPISLLFLLTLPAVALDFSLRFRTLCPLPNPELATLFYLPGPSSAPIEVELPSANFSPVRYATETREIRFFSNIPEPASIPVVVASVPDGIRDAIVLLLPDAVPGRYRALVFDSSLATFRGGDHQFLNLSLVPVGIDLAGEKLNLDPGKSGIIRKNAADGAARQPLQLFHRPENEWVRFSSTRAAINSRIRSLVLIFPDPSEGRLRARAIHDHIDSPAAQ